MLFLLWSAVYRLLQYALIHPGTPYSHTSPRLRAPRSCAWNSTAQTIEVEGQSFRVLLGTSPQEVEQWRNERRSRWPTDKNISRCDGINGSTPEFPL